MTYKSTFPIIGLIILLILIPSTSFAQKYEIFELNHILNTNNKSQSKTEPIDVERLRSLVYDLHPTVYFEDQQVKQYGEGKIVKAEVYPDSYSLLQDINSQYNSVEVLIFKNDEGFLPNIAFDIAKFKSFESLKYIYLNCTSNCSQSQIQQMFTNAENVKIIYNFISSAE